MEDLKVKKLLAFVESLTEGKVSDEILKIRAELTSERSEGNYDDVFADGLVSAEAEIAIAAREVLKEVL